MGNFLDKPITDKETTEGGAHGLDWGCSAMQGWRIEMEDSHITETDVPGRPGTSMFCVFDGHGGSLVAKEAAINLLPVVCNTDKFKHGNKSAETLSSALYDGLLELDEQLRVKTGDGDHSGATAITSFITPTHIVIGNAGDSRAVVARGDGVLFGSADHKPNNPEEKGRVEAAGGYIEMGRVCGNLAVSRALGDFQYKDKPDMKAEQQKITAAADMTVIKREDDDDFLLLACDGIFDVMTNEQVREFIVSHLKGGYKPPQICERLCDCCLDKGSKDNMSAIIILFPNHTKVEPGYVVPSIGPDEEELKRMRESEERDLELQRRLFKLVQGEGTAPASDSSSGP
mmetsp:Transcript_5143/g.15688  ORF Transcript_5143/g.15688 Transcript_5143/m.15688 type:complete len:343 (-) Transcript_5143:162-1190(-)|eukprot:CAMPEP_0182924874 /NCGR_PEP_ID=MMETSP0105_2-20130417/7824_1 /TAXON_ID=81532 ORGANISM="Acanthoeca-like sp., Strain 10tr" /NCGR_SAMPLE_ID=MMETSP0105_2 /ASSEMBLY_ACC=CAM_ASM_000205 /LENGTH=342 /DNA_ID=CAMNT_0025062693 /DNA_START=88 /DNA_END=1116 /DNA_ORIENTATION=+